MMQNQLLYNQRLEALESKIAFQDQTIEEINSVVIALRDQLDLLSAKVKSLSLQASSDFVTKDKDITPPHY